MVLLPGKLKYTADALHALGMYLGTSTAESTNTCAGHMASQGYEALDAVTFAAWGIDYLKVVYIYMFDMYVLYLFSFNIAPHQDGCNNNFSYYADGYPLMGRALEGTQ